MGQDCQVVGSSPKTKCWWVWESGLVSCPDPAPERGKGLMSVELNQQLDFGKSGRFMVVQHVVPKNEILSLLPDSAQPRKQLNVIGPISVEWWVWA